MTLIKSSVPPFLIRSPEAIGYERQGAAESEGPSKKPSLALDVAI